MSETPQGTPVWADGMFPDAEAAKSFYGPVLGWTFRAAESEKGTYTQAYADGKAVAAFVPPLPGREGTPLWCLHLASPDAVAAAARITEHGGRVLLAPVKAGDLGSYCVAADPEGAVFGVWQPGTHKGFEAGMEQVGAYRWAEVVSRDPAADAFYPAVFGYASQQMDDPELDFRVYSAGGGPLLGRVQAEDDYLAGTPAGLNVYFNVAGCDRAVAAAVGHGATVLLAPTDSPFGRFATLTDPQGARFSVLDTTQLAGEVPELTDLP
ncbi:VOC family protein [Streptomyces sp. NPDC003691]